MTTNNETMATVTNEQGALNYEVIDLDASANIVELRDPHTKEKFLVHNALETLELLGYTLK